MTEPTKKRLANALSLAGHAQLAFRAAIGEFDDFESPHAMPEMELVTALRKLGDEAFAQRIIDGEFDGTKEEAEAWLRSEEGRDTLRKFGLSDQ